MSRGKVSGRTGKAVAYGGPIGMLGGLIGLGGAEFRLPVLVGPLGYPARQAVPLNLAISLATLASALAIRGTTAPLRSAAAAYPVIGLIAGGIVGALVGPALFQRLSNERLERVLLWLLVGIGTALIVEPFLAEASAGFVPPGRGWRVAAGAGFGVGIGLVSSLLGVAGGELLIPTLIFAFGFDVRAAGTASLLVSLPTVSVGILRYAKRGAYTERGAILETVLPMSAASVVGAVAGGLLVGLVPSRLLKVMLGCILIVSAIRIFRGSHRTVSAGEPLATPAATGSPG